MFLMARKSKIPKDMAALFQLSSGTLAQIKSKTNSLAILADIVRQICPDLPEDAWHIANFRKNTLIIEVKSPVWGQRLQFERTKICQVLIEHTEGQFQQIEIKVNPYHTKKVITSNEIKLSSKSMSPNTAKHIMDVANNAPEGLKEKLEKLAKHVNK
jgi:hypothetical protein